MCRWLFCLLPAGVFQDGMPPSCWHHQESPCPTQSPAAPSAPWRMLRCIDRGHPSALFPLEKGPKLPSLGSPCTSTTLRSQSPFWPRCSPETLAQEPGKPLPQEQLGTRGWCSAGNLHSLALGRWPNWSQTNHFCNFPRKFPGTWGWWGEGMTRGCRGVRVWKHCWCRLQLGTCPVWGRKFFFGVPARSTP